MVKIMGHELDESDLDERFTNYYNSGERVEVTWKKDWAEDYSGYDQPDGLNRTRFYVGKSTGWKPVYLEIKNRNSSGGAAICSSGIESIKGLGIYR